ncbi:MAG: hypothetical protein ACRD0Z_02710 [Acidimicrobiales bacterium]
MVVIVVVVGVYPFHLLGAPTGRQAGGNTTAPHPSTRPVPSLTSVGDACAKSGCATVDISRSSNRLVVYSGASCSGLLGSWYLNSVVGGPNTSLRPSYALHWVFTSGSKTASPSGTITVPPVGAEKVSITLSDGALAISGTDPDGATVGARGTLSVRLSGTSSAPVLLITEAGLEAAESELGLVSPFEHDGGSVSLPVKIVHSLADC